MSFPDALAEGSVLLQYQIEKVLGQGGFGITYKGMDTRLKMPVAIKEFYPCDRSVRVSDGSIRPKSSLDTELFKKGMISFLQEAQTLGQFRHPNIVQVYNFFEALGTAYMVMAFEEGECLSDRIKRRKRDPLTEEELMTIILPLLDGLHVFHSAGYIHRDIKPGNIYIRKDETPVLLDFGSARQAIGIATKSLTTLLTPGYAPFEQYYSSSKRQGPWTDIYAIGAVLYRIITGRVPTHATDRSSAIMRRETDPVPCLKSSFGLNYSHRFLSAIQHAMQVLESDRPQSVFDFREELLGKKEWTAIKIQEEESTKTVIAKPEESHHKGINQPIPHERQKTQEVLENPTPNNKNPPKIKIDTDNKKPALTVYGTPMPSARHPSKTNDTKRELSGTRSQSISTLYLMLMIANVIFMVFVSFEKIQKPEDIVPVLIVYSGLVNVFPLLWFGVSFLIGMILRRNKKSRPTIWLFIKSTFGIELLGIGVILYLIYG